MGIHAQATPITADLLRRLLPLVSRTVRGGADGGGEVRACGGRGISGRGRNGDWRTLSGSYSAAYAGFGFVWKPRLMIVVGVYVWTSRIFCPRCSGDVGGVCVATSRTG